MRWRGWLVATAAAAALAGGARAADPSHADAFSKEGLVKADISDLKDTRLMPHPDAPLPAHDNVVWCGTLQLAWNEAIRLVGEPLQFIHQPPVVDLLNRQDFTRDDLDAGSYVAIADFERNNVEDEIRAALEKTFGGAASPELIPAKPAHPGPYDFTAYAYLYKNLAFEQPFLDGKPLDFAGTKVKTFGFTAQGSPLRDTLAGQVSICDYRSDDDFVIKLKTQLTGDELILAKIPPASTKAPPGPSLAVIMNEVLTRAGSTHAESPGPRDTLAVPKLNFDLRGHFPELEHLVLKPGPHAKVHDLETSNVEQLVRFQLSERGAVLKSEGTIQMVGTALILNPPPVHRLVFDKPFLILMKRKDAPRAYLALWVGNASLLEPAK
ncbi:MAG: hypothetical protein WDO13_15525 [Verrucomicrobiota bacterium]